MRRQLRRKASNIMKRSKRRRTWTSRSTTSMTSRTNFRTPQKRTLCSKTSSRYCNNSMASKPRIRTSKSTKWKAGWKSSPKEEYFCVHLQNDTSKSTFKRLRYISNMSLKMNNRSCWRGDNNRQIKRSKLCPSGLWSTASCRRKTFKSWAFPKAGNFRFSWLLLNESLRCAQVPQRRGKCGLLGSITSYRVQLLYRKSWGRITSNMRWSWKRGRRFSSSKMRISTRRAKDQTSCFRKLNASRTRRREAFRSKAKNCSHPQAWSAKSFRSSRIWRETRLRSWRKQKVRKTLADERRRIRRKRSKIKH